MHDSGFTLSSYIWLDDVTSGDRVLLTSKGNVDKVNYGPARFSTDGRGVYLTHSPKSKRHLYGGA